MPKLVRLYITQCLVGFGISALFTLGLIYFDVMGLKHLFLNSRDGYLGAFMIFFSNGVVFAGVQFAISVMRLKEDDRPGGGTRLPLLARPVRVEATAKARKQR